MQVASLLAPLLHPGSLGVEVRASLLLLGPPGSGRRTAARAAAAALGLHYIPVSGYELRVRPRSPVRLWVRAMRPATATPPALHIARLSCCSHGAQTAGRQKVQAIQVSSFAVQTLHPVPHLPLLCISKSPFHASSILRAQAMLRLQRQ